ncbi:hypothetical protein [Marinilabilia sp.]|uniref:hypothetical protein n=1 Tax=Marinilabilia sp. TaxID=2021252 RepID=UPI0025BBC8BA|nr:hypothetical protein [Marinilabilia sp.]
MTNNHFFIKKFILVEEKYDLFNLQINEINIWPIIRFNLFSLLLQKCCNTQESHPKVNTVSSLIIVLRNFFASIIYSPFLLRQNKKTIVFNHKRKVKNDSGLFECKYTEFLTGDDTYVFEAPFNDKHFKPTATKNIVYLDLILNIARIYSIYGSKKRISPKNLRILDRMHAIIKSEFGVNVNNFNAYVMKMLYKHRAISFFAERVLKNIKPERLVVSVSYSDANMPFVEKAKSMGIKVIEIQHGILGRDHIAYNFMNKKEFNWFPDEIWVWSKFWKKSSRFPISEDKIVVKGFPFLDSYKSGWKRRETDKQQILVISQGPFSDNLIEFTRRLNSKINHSKYQIIFKPHPSELIPGRKKFQQLNNENIIVSKESNIYELFGTSSYQIGVSSTALFEGLEFDLRTFILDAGPVDIWNDIKGVIMVKNEDDVLKHLS